MMQMPMQGNLANLAALRYPQMPPPPQLGMGGFGQQPPMHLPFNPQQPMQPPMAPHVPMQGPMQPPMQPQQPMPAWGSQPPMMNPGLNNLYALRNMGGY